jgi:hypothetical protein
MQKWVGMRDVRLKKAEGHKHRTPSHGRGSESAPTRTRTWNPLIKRVECSRHCQMGSRFPQSVSNRVRTRDGEEDTDSQSDEQVSSSGQSPPLAIDGSTFCLQDSNRQPRLHELPRSPPSASTIRMNRPSPSSDRGSLSVAADMVVTSRSICAFSNGEILIHTIISRRI